MTNSSAWVPDNYTLTFTTATQWEITDSATPTANVVATGAYTPGSAIAFNGAQVVISGTPAAGDTFSINQSRGEDMFSTLSGIVDALRSACERLHRECQARNEPQHDRCSSSTTRAITSSAYAPRSARDCLRWIPPMPRVRT